MTQQTQPPRPDPIGDFQRWLMKSGAKGLGREVRGNLRKTFGRPAGEDVWSQATREEPDEPPECEWCPICRAARKYRDSSGPGVGGHLTGAGDAFASVLSDAFSAVESALSVVRTPSAPKTPSGSPEPSVPGWRSGGAGAGSFGRVSRGGERVRGRGRPAGDRRRGAGDGGPGDWRRGHGRAGRVGSGHRGRPGRAGR